MPNGWLEKIKQYLRPGASSLTEQSTTAIREVSPDMVLKPEILEELLSELACTRSDEIDCDDCFEQSDQFIDMHLTGKNAAEALPLVKDHLDRCGDCHEEFEALLKALEVHV